MSADKTRAGRMADYAAHVAVPTSRPASPLVQVDRHWLVSVTAELRRLSASEAALIEALEAAVSLIDHAGRNPKRQVAALKASKEARNG